MKQYETFELIFKGNEPDDSFADIDLKAIFTIDGESVTVNGFYAGNNTYKIRFFPKKTGVYTWIVSGLFSDTGEEICQKADENVHGMVHAEGLHFEYDDKKIYYPVGTTIYALMHQDKELIETTMDTLSKAPFNKVRLCVFPKHYDFNHNEPELYAYEKTDGKWDVHKPCFEFWNHFEEGISRLYKMGIQVDLIIFHPYDRWGFAELSKEDSLTYLDYLLRRFSALPNIWWSLANEYDFMGNYEYQDWVDFGKYIYKNDPYRHCLSNHNGFVYWDFGLDEITHCSIQDSNVHEVPDLQRKYNKPVVFDECRYEGNIHHSWGNISAREMVNRFWVTYTLGGYCTHGETYYSDDDVLWWARGGVLKGDSPARIAFLRSILSELPGPLECVNEGQGRYTFEMIMDMKKNGMSEEFKYDFFANGLVKLPEERIQPYILNLRPCFAHVGEEAYLRYYDKDCCAKAEMKLPENRRYKIEILDTWEMTRTVFSECANGKISIELPGKEGMAVYAYAL